MGASGDLMCYECMNTYAFTWEESNNEYRRLRLFVQHQNGIDFHSGICDVVMKFRLQPNVTFSHEKTSLFKICVKRAVIFFFFILPFIQIWLICKVHGSCMDFKIRQYFYRRSVIEHISNN